MIDIIKAKKAFKQYVKKFDINDGKIRLKIAHIERTSRNSKKTSRIIEYK